MSLVLKLALAIVYLASVAFQTNALAQNQKTFSASLYGGGAGVFRQNSENQDTPQVSDAELVAELRALIELRALAPTTTQTVTLRGEDIFDDRGRSVNRVASLGWNAQIRSPRTQSVVDLTAADRNFSGSEADLNSESPLPLQGSGFRQQSLDGVIRSQFSWDRINTSGGRIRAQRRFVDSAGTNEGLSVFQQRALSELTTLGAEVSADRSTAEGLSASDPSTTRIAVQSEIYGQQQIARTISLRASLGAGRLFDVYEDETQNFVTWGGEANWRERVFSHRATIRQGVSTLSVTGQLAQTTEIRLQSQWSPSVDHTFRIEGSLRIDTPLFKKDLRLSTRTELNAVHEWALGYIWTEPTSSRSDSQVYLLTGVSAAWDQQKSLAARQILRTGILTRL